MCLHLWDMDSRNLRNYRNWIYSLVTGCWIAFAGCSKSEEITEHNVSVKGGGSPVVVVPMPPKPLLVLQLNHIAGSQVLEFDKRYLNQWGEQFTVDVFRYYLSNMVLIYDSATRIPLPETYFLVDQGKDASRTIQLPKIPEGNLTGIEMLIGVDAPRNYSGAQTGALDPALGMFWTWNSGYIMAKIEGSYLKGGNPNASYIWHCGGYDLPYSSIRQVNLSFPQTGIDTLQKTTIDLNVDVLEWFKTPNQIRIDSIPVFNDPSTLSVKVADNYADMFTVKAVNKTPF